MKKKIMIAFLVVILVFVISKIINFVVINRTYRAIESFKENNNRYYCASGKDSDMEYSEKIFLKNGIVKYVFLDKDEELYYKWKNVNTNEYYYIDIKDKIVNFNDVTNVDTTQVLINLPRMITSVFCDSNNKYISLFFKIKYIFPTKYEDKNCFEIVTNSEILIIDAKTYLPRYVLRKISDSDSNEIKTEIFYEFKVDTVTEEEVALPDLSEYQIIE